MLLGSLFVYLTALLPAAALYGFYWSWTSVGNHGYDLTCASRWKRGGLILGTRGGPLLLYNNTEFSVLDNSPVSNWRSVVYKFFHGPIVAIGDNVLYSDGDDGSGFQLETFPPFTFINIVDITAEGDGFYALVTAEKNLWRSSGYIGDGDYQSVLNVTNHWMSIKSVANVAIAINTTHVYHSTTYGKGWAYGNDWANATIDWGGDEPVDLISLALDNESGDVFAYIGTAAGTVFGSQDNGATWTKLSFVSDHAINAIASSADTVMVASDAVYLSEDGGITWSVAVTSPETFYYALLLGEGRAAVLSRDANGETDLLVGQSLPSSEGAKKFPVLVVVLGSVGCVLLVLLLVPAWTYRGRLMRCRRGNHEGKLVPIDGSAEMRMSQVEDKKLPQDVPQPAVGTAENYALGEDALVKRGVYDNP